MCMSGSDVFGGVENEYFGAVGEEERCDGEAYG